MYTEISEAATNYYARNNPNRLRRGAESVYLSLPYNENVGAVPTEKDCQSALLLGRDSHTAPYACLSMRRDSFLIVFIKRIR